MNGSLLYNKLEYSWMIKYTCFMYKFCVFYGITLRGWVLLIVLDKI